jgi:hypothetical protein
MYCRNKAPRRNTLIFLLFAELSALAATLYLFLAPAFPKYQGIIFPDSKPPGFETGWQHFGFWPPIPGTPPNFVVLFSFVAPPIIILIAALSLNIKLQRLRVAVLWAAILGLVITLLYRPFDIGYFFVPSAVFLFAASISETRDLRKSPSPSLRSQC